MNTRENREILATGDQPLFPVRLSTLRGTPLSVPGGLGVGVGRGGGDKVRTKGLEGLDGSDRQRKINIPALKIPENTPPVCAVSVLRTAAERRPLETAAGPCPKDAGSSAPTRRRGR
jgi:hypothetical protein